MGNLLPADEIPDELGHLAARDVDVSGRSHPTGPSRANALLRCWQNLRLTEILLTESF